MRIVFFGTPEFAVVTLGKLFEAGYDIVLVVTQPDKPRDRGKKLQCSPVKDMAVLNGVTVLAPEYLKGNIDFYYQLKSVAGDIFIVVAYGKILPCDIIALPAMGCINIHASLLPRFRGAAPIQRAVMEGEEETGISLMYVNEEMDAGDIIAVSRTTIGNKNAKDLFAELSITGATLLLEELPRIASGLSIRTPQDSSLATYAPVIRKEEGHLDFNKTPVELDRIVRGMNAQSGAYVNYKDRILKIWETIPIEGYSSPAAYDGASAPGTVLSASDEGLIISALGGALKVTMLQAPGKKVMATGEYLRGNKINKGDVFY